jgi:hypothetical protein
MLGLEPFIVSAVLTFITAIFFAMGAALKYHAAMGARHTLDLA